MKMTKAQQAKFEKILSQIAAKQGTTPEELREAEGINSNLTYVDQMIEAQSTLNFFIARIQPLMEKGEAPFKFDKRFREWRFRTCEGCQEEFAYAYAYEGVKYCSLDCLSDALEKIGLKLTVGRDLKKRWGPHYHPAIVPSSALSVLKSAYGEQFPDSFDPSADNHPMPLSS
jgi:hypothetical protein